MAKFAATGTRTQNAAAIDRIRARLAGVSEARLQTAANRAVSSVRRKFEPVAKRVIRDVYNVKLGDLGGKFRVLASTDGNGEFVELSASTRGIPLMRFGARWGGPKTAGATAQVRSGLGKTYQSAFIATVGGQRHVFARQFSADSNSPSGRHPRDHIRRLMGPSPLQMTQGLDDKNASEIARQMTAFLSSEIKRQVRLSYMAGGA